MQRATLVGPLRRRGIINPDPRVPLLANSFRSVLIPALVLSLVTSCSGDGSGPTETDGATGLTILDGDAQTGTAGEELDEPLVVRITTNDGEPIEGATVAWSVTTGGGSIEPERVTTDAEGRVEATWRLGNALNEQTVTATMDGFSAVFRATASDARIPSTMIPAGGDDQRGPVGAQLLNPLVVLVENEFGRPIAGLEVEWSVESGGGNVSPNTTTTDADGRAQVQWTLGPTAGQQTALATVAGVSARFRATAEGR